MTGDDFKFDDSVAGVLVQYPDTTGSILDYEGVVASAHPKRTWPLRTLGAAAGGTGISSALATMIG